MRLLFRVAALAVVLLVGGWAVLFCLANGAAGWADREAETLISPHPGEAARLLGSSIPEVQKDRIAAAQRLSRELNAHVDLKGNGSVIVARDGHWFENTSGNPGMASAGMGDVLSGIHPRRAPRAEDLGRGGTSARRASARRGGRRRRP